MSPLWEVFPQRGGKLSDTIFEPLIRRIATFYQNALLGDVGRQKRPAIRASPRADFVEIRRRNVPP